jgi:HSP20 family protein
MGEVPVKTAAKPAAKLQAARKGEWHPLGNLRSDIDRLFEDFMPSWGRPFAGLPTAFDAPFTRRAFEFAPAIDLVEKAKEFEITAELPGIDEKDVEVKLANGCLTIKGEKSEAREEKDKEFFVAERSYGSFQRTFGLPEGIDAAKIEAHFAKGVLTVKLPKTAEAQQGEKKIAVRAA